MTTAPLTSTVPVPNAGLGSSIRGQGHAHIGIKRLIWLYFWLLIFEGALRRWILPSLAAPLLLIREPVAIAILVMAAQAGLLRHLPLYVAAGWITVVSFMLTMVFGHGNLGVALFGARIMLLDFPLIFVIARVFNLADVLRMGRACAILAIPMTFLIAAQFYLPQSHFVNIGVGGEGTAGFDATADRFRPPGTFSFTMGVTEFYSLVGALLIALAIIGRAKGYWWWKTAVVATALAVPLSISRSLFLQLILSAAVVAFGALSNGRLFTKILGAIITVGLFVWIATFIPAFHTALEAFMDRWTSANDSEGGLVTGVIADRFLGGLWSALTSADQVPLAGLGLGLGTNVGAFLQTGERAFLIAEGEWARIVGEMGPLLGLALIGIRVGTAITILWEAFQSWRDSNPVPMILASVAILWVAQGNWAQPTSLGFAVLAGGLTLAATRVPIPRSVKRTAVERNYERGIG